MKHILPKMFVGLFKIVLDPIHSDEIIENPHEGTGFDLLYSRQKGIQKRRAAQDGIYPIKELDKRPVYPKNFLKKKNFTKFVSDFTVTSIENTAELDDNSSKVAGQKPKPKMFSP